MTTKRPSWIRNALLAGGLAVAAWPAAAAEVTPERLIHADKEPQNWLMNHRTYDGQRYSPLDRINTDNIKGLKLAYAVPLGGGSGNEFNQATPLADVLALHGVEMERLAKPVEREFEAYRLSGVKFAAAPNEGRVMMDFGPHWK